MECRRDRAKVSVSISLTVIVRLAARCVLARELRSVERLTSAIEDVRDLGLVAHAEHAAHDEPHACNGRNHASARGTSPQLQSRCNNHLA
jgi:hypothetical protein